MLVPIHAPPLPYNLHPPADCRVQQTCRIMQRTDSQSPQKCQGGNKIFMNGAKVLICNQVNSLVDNKQS